MDDFIRTVDIDQGFQSFVSLISPDRSCARRGIRRSRSQIRTVLDRNDINVPYFANHCSGAVTNDGA